MSLRTRLRFLFFENRERRKTGKTNNQTNVMRRFWDAIRRFARMQYARICAWKLAAQNDRTSSYPWVFWVWSRNWEPFLFFLVPRSSFFKNTFPLWRNLSFFNQFSEFFHFKNGKISVIFASFSEKWHQILCSEVDWGFESRFRSSTWLWE